MARNERRECEIEGCDNLLAPNARLETCASCRSMFGRWKKRPSAALLAYQGRLEKWQNRIIYMAGDTKRYERVIQKIKGR